MMSILVVKIIASLYVEIKGRPEPAKTQESNQIKSVLNIAPQATGSNVGWGTKQNNHEASAISVVLF